jgi:F-box/leucine-rich repeat protein 16
MHGCIYKVILKQGSLSGCGLLTPSGLTGLMQLISLVELELTNCPGATPDVCIYLKENMPKCLVIE